MSCDSKLRFAVSFSLEPIKEVHLPPKFPWPVLALPMAWVGRPAERSGSCRDPARSALHMGSQAQPASRLRDPRNVHTVQCLRVRLFSPMCLPIR